VTVHDFRVRPYQRSFHETWSTLGKRRLIEIAHRRWGKDEIALNISRDLALQRPASYWHCLPEYAQARKAIWAAVNPHTGQRRIDEAFPSQIRESVNEQEMFIKLRNGATWQIVGSDRYNALVGSGVAGVTFSEWALANPSAWAYIRPMVEENNGWAAFITTPRGNNHAKAMYDMAKGNPAWFAEVSPITATGALSQEQLDEALAEYQAIYGLDFGLALFEQEYLCSFSGAMIGAYFGSEMSRAEREGRVKDLPIDPNRPVHTAWDLGKAVNNPIWCFQVVGQELRIVDLYVPESDDLEQWCAWLAGRGYSGNDYVPHDVMTTEWGSKRTRIEVLRALGRKPKAVPKYSVADGLQAGRMAINAALFHSGKDDRANRVAHGIDGLKAYRREWDDDRKTFRETPYKDWSEHIGSAWRYLGLSWKDERVEVPKPKPKQEAVYTARPDGTVVSNMSIREQIETMARRRRGNRDV
jgi:phage terminase large subunit